MLRNPEVLPPEALQFSLFIDCAAGDDGANHFPQIALPPELVEAAPKRRLEFRAGRYCAWRALQMLEPGFPVPALPRSVSGAPQWPAGITGSITHAGGFVSAAVARVRDARAVALDSEQIVTGVRALRISNTVAWPSELAHTRATGFNRLEALTLAFSIKEAVFKALHADVGWIFAFHDVRIVAIDDRGRTFRVRLVRTLSSEFTAGTVLEGQFEFEAPWIHTGIFIPQVS